MVFFFSVKSVQRCEKFLRKVFGFRGKKESFYIVFIACIGNSVVRLITVRFDSFGSRGNPAWRKIVHFCAIGVGKVQL